MINQKILEYITGAKTVLIVSHKKPDGDSLGSSLALFSALKQLHKKCYVFSADEPGQYFNYLPKIENILSDSENLDLKNFDLIVTLDCGDLKQTGIEDLISRDFKNIFLINIDHHRTNENFGHLNLVIENASSTSEIVYNIIKNLDVIVDKDIATCLLAGILTDTSNFTNAATNFSSLKIAADLLLRGARFNQINESTFKNKPIATLKLWGKILSRLEQNELGLVSAVITLNDLEDSQLDASALEGVANFLNNLDGARGVLVLKEERSGVIKGSMRSNDDALDVSEISKIFGGGGHRKAAGFTIKGKLVEREGSWAVI
jgi:phosphoesterase RecJ-like protein